jgi:hypothetical protein
MMLRPQYLGIPHSSRKALAMNRVGLLLACCVLFSACTVVDAGVGRGARDWTTHFDANAYADFGWPTNDSLLSLDIVGGPNSYTLVTGDIWRLLHLELGLLGAGIGIGPFQIGAGIGLYAPHAPARIAGDNPIKG